MTYRSLPKALSLALVMAAASFGPLLVPGTALAEAPQEAAGANASPKAESSSESKPKHASKGKHKAKKGATAKAHTKAATHAKAEKTDKAEKSEKTDKAASKPAKTKRTAARENKPSAKRAKAPAKADDSPQPTGARSKACTGTTVSLDRGGVESEKVALVDCHGKVTDGAVAKVSVLARPWGAPKKSVSKSKRVDSSIVERIDAVAKKFPGRTITLVGAPATTGSGSSAHQAGRAVDLRVDGVDNQKVAELCRTLADTGCGFYPNASFVHMDARAAGAGKVYWIDASEPGEPPRYVTSWPPSSARATAEPPAASKVTKTEP